MKVVIFCSIQHFEYVSPLTYEKSGVHVIRLPLHVISCFHLAAYKIFSLAFSIFIVICGCESFFIYFTWNLLSFIRLKNFLPLYF